MKYYYSQHLRGYAQVKAEGKTAWAEIYGDDGFENFSARDFLTAALPHLHFDTPQPDAFIYGCGTGPDACFLAERGFRVDAIDLIPTAIEIAREQAALRGLDIHYAVQDICELSPEGMRYDMIVDSYCLQCIVFNNERQKLYSTVRARLKPQGYYVISTACLDAEHQTKIRDSETVTDSATGTLYTRYVGDQLIEANTGFVLTPLIEEQSEYPDAVHINDKWYLPHRRHLTGKQLEAELNDAGFQVIYCYPEHAGSVVCGHK